MFEVDFLPVGDGEKSGDAIALRFDSHDPGNQAVVVIDGGFQTTGEALVEHFLSYYGTDRIDLMISTHPDADHINGLRVVLEQLDVGELMMHLPWMHTDDIASMFRDGRVTDTSVSESLRASLEAACGLEQAAHRRGVPIVEPFMGVQRFGGALTIVGPSLAYYESLLPQFRGLPMLKTLEATLARAASAVLTLVRETLHLETLDDTGETSAENNTSAIVQFALDDRRLLFTGDAGMPALTEAADYMDITGMSAQELTVLDVPHHGSAHNVGPTILDRLLGEPHTRAAQSYSAIVSASAGASKHPSRKVTNALNRRGALVATTEGTAVCYHHGTPTRHGWSAVTPVPFFDEVED